MAMHAHQVPLADDTAAALVRRGFPELAHLPVRRLRTSGTVNAIFRVGTGHAARFPLVGDDPGATGELLQAEAVAAAEFASVSPFPAPAPLGHGEPGPGYPLPWTLQTWVPGEVAAGSGHGAGFAADLAELVLALRAADTGGRSFSGSNRGGDLRDHDSWVQECLRRSTDLLDVTELGALWQRLRDLPRGGVDVLAHGDLIPGNLLVRDGRLAGVLDTGGFAAADPALDVIVAWHLLDEGPRAVLRAELGCDDLEWERGKAWAFEQALGAVWYDVDTNPAMARMGRRTLARILAS